MKIYCGSQLRRGRWSGSGRPSPFSQTHSGHSSFQAVRASSETIPGGNGDGREIGLAIQDRDQDLIELLDLGEIEHDAHVELDALRDGEGVSIGGNLKDGVETALEGLEWKTGHGNDLRADYFLVFFSRTGINWPEDFLLGGIIDEATYYKVKGEIEREIDENTRQAQEGQTEIIQVAREMGLSPRPTGKDPDFWWANCPTKSHPLEIKASVNEFFCGYCRRKGGMEELRVLVRERRGF